MKADLCMLNDADHGRPCVVAVSISPGGIPKLPREVGYATAGGIVGDGRNHTKHIRPDRAVSLWDLEILEQLIAEGFNLTPGSAGENLTVRGLNVQAMAPGTLLAVGEAILKLEQPRKPCYVLDAIDPRLKEVVVGRCGYMASVVREGAIRPGMTIQPISEITVAAPVTWDPRQPASPSGAWAAPAVTG